ncbi:hypothetical protein L7F22_022036 [Adiantum nelumboides]|nr:hypothetical protein [Adiantum nelumboides]
MKARMVKNQTTIQEELQETKQQLKQERESTTVIEDNKPMKASSGGSVLVDKVLEPSDALLQAYEARLKTNQTLEQRWLTNRQSKVESERLEMCKKLIEAAQELMEPNAVRALEREVLIHKEQEKQEFKESEQVNGPRPDTILSLDHRVVPNTTNDTKSMVMMSIPEVEEPWPQLLWETIKNRKDGSATLQSALISKIHLDNEFYPEEEEYVPILEQAHSGQAGGHFSADKMAKAIHVVGIWWPTLFMDAKEYVKRCDDCQRMKTPRGRDDMPLSPMMGARAFVKWGIDFVGSIVPHAYRTLHAQYIIVATDYLTKWVATKTTAKNDAKTTVQFLYENIFTRYGLPIEIVSDRGTHFIDEVIEFLLDEFMVIHQKSAPFHPQDNG